MNFLNDIYKELEAVNESALKEEVIVPVEDAVKDNDTGIEDGETLFEHLLTEASIEFHAIYENYVYDRIKNNEAGKAIIDFIKSLIAKIKELYGSFKAYIKKLIARMRGKADKNEADLKNNADDIVDTANEERTTTMRERISKGETLDVNYIEQQIKSSDIVLACDEILIEDLNKGICYDMIKSSLDDIRVAEKMMNKFEPIAADRTDEFFTEAIAFKLVKVKTSDIEEIKKEIVRINGFKTVKVNQDNLLDTLHRLNGQIKEYGKLLDTAIKQTDNATSKLEARSRKNMEFAAKVTKENKKEVARFIARVIQINIHVMKVRLLLLTAIATCNQEASKVFDELSGGEL